MKAQLAQSAAFSSAPELLAPVLIIEFAYYLLLSELTAWQSKVSTIVDS